MGTIGEELKAARLKKSLDLEEIAEQTHISRRHLDNLEKDRLDQLPGGELRWLILRQYAQLLDLNTEDLYRRYRQFSSTQIKGPVIPAGKRSRLAAHRPFFRFVFTTLVTVVLLVLGGLGLWHEISSRQTEIQNAQTAAQAPSLQDLPLLTMTTTTLAADPGLSPPTSVGMSSSSTLPATNNAITYAMNLWIEFQAPCWVSVNVDGRQVTRQEFYRGEKLPFRANNQVSLILGNAGGVNIQINGSPMRKLGALGEVKRLIFTPDNYKEYLAEAPPPSP
jgi:cytoskeletal protein RodZ